MHHMDSLTNTLNQIPIIFFIAILVISLYALKLLFVPGKKRNFPPIAGTIFHQLVNFPRFVEFQTDLSRKYKTFRIITPFCNSVVYTVDPANVEYILKTNFANYGKGPHNHELLSDLLGDGIFVVDGDKWRQQRRIGSLEFSTKVLRNYSSQVFRKTATKLAQMVSEFTSSNQMMDIQDLFMKSTMDSIFKVGLGVDLGTLSDSEESKAFSKAFDEASAQTFYRVVDIFWKIKRFLNIGSEARMKKNVKLIDDFINNVIDKKTEHMSTQKGDFMKKEDILSRFILEKEKDPSAISNKYLRDIILSFVIAGRDTSAGTLSWFFYLLSKHSSIQEKIAREVRDATKILEDSSNVEINEFITCLTEEKINSMQYLHASLTETLRLYPPVPQDLKYCFSDDTLPDGFEIKKGESIAYQPFPMGRMKFLWGDDAEEFKPERWLDKEGRFVSQSPFKFTAFQAGPRICLGKELAYMQMKIFAATMLFFFKFQMWDESHQVKGKTMLTLQIDAALHLRVLQRN